MTTFSLFFGNFFTTLENKVMRYVVKNELGYYKFFRKIPYTNKQFIFSLRTKNYKIACKIARLFLIKSDIYFKS